MEGMEEWPEANARNDIKQRGLGSLMDIWVSNGIQWDLNRLPVTEYTSSRPSPLLRLDRCLTRGASATTLPLQPYPSKKIQYLNNKSL